MSKTAIYEDLLVQLRALLAGHRDFLAATANTAALVYDALAEVNWAGFYFHRGGRLIVGPFQGKPACVEIALGRGVCGTAAQRRQTIVVPDVHDFPGHIACDSASRSEIVVPLIRHGQLLGVLDLDSPRPARFDDEDRAGLESLVAVLLESTDRPALDAHPATNALNEGPKT